MSDEDIPCLGICQTDEFGYCIGCGRRAEVFPATAAEAQRPDMPDGTQPKAPLPPPGGEEAEKA